MSLQDWITIAVPTVILIFQTGAIVQALRQLKHVVTDHETRIRRVERRTASRSRNPEKNQNRI